MRQNEAATRTKIGVLYLMVQRRLIRWILLLPMCAAGCSGSSLEPQSQITLGQIVATKKIKVPTSVNIGQGFLVKVTTVGDGCFEHASTQVAVNGLVATIIPLDEVNVTPGVACQSIEKHFRHDAIVRFRRAGQAVVRIQGFDTTIERTVLVQ